MSILGCQTNILVKKTTTVQINTNVQKMVDGGWKRGMRGSEVEVGEDGDC